MTAAIGKFNEEAYFAAGAGAAAGDAGAAAAGGAVNSLSAFCTVKVRPQPRGTTTINQAKKINAGDDFLIASIFISPRVGLVLPKPTSYA